jgi:hypothetical protein
VGKIFDVSEDLYDQLIDQLRTSHFTLQVDEAISVVKDLLLITYIR